MSIASEQTADPSALKRIRALSRPICILLSVALALIVLVQVPEILAVLFAFHPGDAWQANLGFNQIGFDVSVFQAVHAQAPPPGAVAIERLETTQRAAVAALAVLCGGSYAMALLSLRQLFALYSRGIVFSADNVRRMKQFALWLVVAAVVINGSSHLFSLSTGAASNPTANAVMAVLFGGMIYVIARVMELACEADAERREFV